MDSTEIYNVEEYIPTKEDLFFFDNNIWIFLFCPLGEHQYYRQKIYSSFLKKILDVGALVFINDLVLSEFSNTYFRLDFNYWKKEQKGNYTYKKDYVGTPRYQKIASDIHYAIDDILDVATHSNLSINELGLDDVLSNIEYIDFNDSFYLEQAKKGHWKIVTDDKDFQKVSSQVSIITRM